jgi:hypothetical protein
MSLFCIFLSVPYTVLYLLCSQVFKKFGEAGLLGINKPTGCGGQGLDYKFQVEKSVNKKGWSFVHQLAHWLWRPGLDYKFHVEKSVNKKGLSFGHQQAHWLWRTRAGLQILDRKIR